MRVAGLALNIEQDLRDGVAVGRLFFGGVNTQYTDAWHRLFLRGMLGVVTSPNLLGADALVVGLRPSALLGRQAGKATNEDVDHDHGRDREQQQRNGDVGRHYAASPNFFVAAAIHSDRGT